MAVSLSKQAFKLFSEGKGPNSDEVKALGAVYDTRQAMYYRWQKMTGKEEVHSEDSIVDPPQKPPSETTEVPPVELTTTLDNTPKAEVPQQKVAKPPSPPPPPLSPSPRIPPSAQPISVGTLEKSEEDREEDEREKRKAELLKLLEETLIKETQGDQKLTEGTNFVIYQAMQATEYGWGWPKYKDRNKWIQIFIRTMMEKHDMVLPAFVDMRQLSQTQGDDGGHQA